MTNTTASTKCPSTLTSGKYGMSQHLSIIDNSKEYIFVKLTDSALRSIEEYQCAVQTRRLVHGQRAQIQFIGNGGIIHFPVAEASARSGPAEGRKFGFAVDDVEGSLECIQQTGPNLDVLGSLNYRMRIHANDDVYDTTRTKMAIAEETEKSKCIREIKPNQTDIGRKVKRPLSATSAQAYATNGGLGSGGGNNGNSINGNNSNSSYINNSKINRNKLSSLTNYSPSKLNGSSSSCSNTSALLHSSTSSRMKASSNSSPNPTLMGGSGTIDNGSRYGGTSNLSSAQSHNPSFSAAASLSSALTGGITTGYQSASNSQYSLLDVTFQNNSKTLGGSSSSVGRNNANSQLRGKGSGRGNSSSFGGGGGKSLDVSRRKLRERLIHLLALKPFKKPELFARLQNEGLSQRDRNNITNLLKDISTLVRDNTYNLKHNLWNNVDENWPYFTEQERQQLKRRKPQNLTPPNSSDAGSTTSGQSPTSHTGSPPPQGSTLAMLKRARMDYADMYEGTSLNGVHPKKQRISHYKKNSLEAGMMSSSAAGLRMLSSSSSYTNNSNSSTYNVFQKSRNSSPYSPNNYNNNIGGNQIQLDDGYPTKVMFPAEINNSINKITAKEKRLNSVRDGLPLRRNNTSTSVAFTHNFVLESQRSNEDKNNSSNNNRTLHLQQQNDSHKSMSLNNNTTLGHNNISTKNGTAVTSCSTTSGSGRGSRHHSSSAPESRKHSRLATPSQMQSPQKRNRGNSNNGSNVGNNSKRHQNNSITDSSKYPSRVEMPQSPYDGDSQSRLESVHQKQQQQQQQSLMKQSLPTEQEIADVASSFSIDTVGDTVAYDFSNYTTITTVEQRRRYRSDFESEYGEYLELSAKIGSVQNRFREMGERMATLQPDCRDYYKIKNQIIQEYENLRKEQEAINKNNERLNYLGAKLGYIKQLVAEFDKKLKAGEIRIAPHELQRQTEEKHHHPVVLQEETVNVPTTTEFSLKATLPTDANISPMVQSAGESNCSPLTVAHQQQQEDEHNIHDHQDLQLQHQQHYHHRAHHYHNDHHQQRQHYQQHHEPETIDVGEGEQQKQQQLHPKSDQQQGIGSENCSDYQSEEQQFQQHSQYLQNHNNSDSDGDDSSSSCSSSDDDDEEEDDDDDDKSIDDGTDDDDDSNNNSNDDYDDNDGDHHNNAPY